MLDGLSIIISIVINGAIPSVGIPNGAIIEEGTTSVYMITEDTNQPIVQE